MIGKLAAGMMGTESASRSIVSQAADSLKARALRFALQIVAVCRTLPNDWEGRHVADQLFRSGTGVAANYHAACRARSRRDFIAKMGIVVEEAEETVFWLIFATSARLAAATSTAEPLAEGRELLAIFAASAKTASLNLRAQKPSITN